jgi:hypothetical protein
LNSNGVTSGYWLPNPSVHQLGASSMGHFPMSEDPVQFKQYLMPVLAEIEAKS